MNETKGYNGMACEIGEEGGFLFTATFRTRHGDLVTWIFRDRWSYHAYLEKLEAMEHVEILTYGPALVKD